MTRSRARWLASLAALGLLVALVSYLKSDDTALAEKSQAQESSVCRGKENITRALNKLLLRLMSEDTRWNGTLTEVREEMKSVVSQYLDIESVYRLAQDQEKTSYDAAKYAINKVEKLKSEKEVQEKVVDKKKIEYPVKKQSIDEDRELILTLIKLVESIGSGSDSKSSAAASHTAAEDILGNIESDAKVFLSIGSRTKLRNSPGIKAQLLALQKLAKKGSQMMAAPVSQEEIENTKNEVKMVLLELLRDPDFQEFLLHEDLAGSVDSLLKVNEEIQQNELHAAAMFSKADQAKEQVADSSLEREKVAGSKLTATVTYDHVEEAAKPASISREREALLVRALLGGIESYCRSGVFRLNLGR